MVHMNTKCTIEGVSGIAKGLPGFCRSGLTRSCIDKNALASDNFGLIAVQNRNIVEGSVQRTGLLSRHQLDVSHPPRGHNELNRRQ